mmetsp:Transcript_11542/g.17638  ORF Transcript_11542/g.17638 Transcript_11542/m.17638 type:complete len:101 (+) Transcript_11542:1048-1350(+)
MATGGGGKCLFGQGRHKRRVKLMMKVGRKEVAEIVECLRDTLEYCDGKTVALVLRQGVPNAQGADVLLFVLKHTKDGLRLELSVFQAKNWATTRYASLRQ